MDSHDETFEAEYQAGEIAWNELITSDPEAAIEFYTRMFGWETEVFPIPDIEYTMFKIGGEPFAGVVKAPQEGVAPHWLNYVVVEDLDEMVARTSDLGGEVLAGPMDIPEVGRIAVIRDPQGATIGLHELLESEEEDESADD